MCLNKKSLYTPNTFVDRMKDVIESWFEKAESLFREGKFQESIVFYDKILNINPLNIAALNDKGDSLSRMNQHHAAIECFDCAIDLLPENSLKRADVLCNKASSLIALENLTGALECLDTAIDIDPSNWRCWFNRGSVMLALNRRSEMEKSYQKVLELRPEYREVVEMLLKNQALT
jgi:tetratricopeptide (TPR) repeat protein